MTVDWERVTALFGAARTLDAAEREAFLHVACASNAALRAEVEALLAADTDDDFLETPPTAAIHAALSARLGVLAPGTILKDRYRIDEPLATGGQALVYRGTDTVLSRAVVVKVMRTSRHGNRWLASRFEHEMRALSRIDHPGVVGILDVGALPDGAPFLVMQHVDGVSLRAVLQHGPLERSRAAHLLRQLGSALGAAHAAGVAHQDLKPENIMIQRLGDGTEAIKLIDFGLAKVDRMPLETGVTTVMVAGTVRYMAPEQFQGENSPACDVYAAACVACEMMSGEPDVRALPKRLSSSTRRLLDAALSLRPADRPSDIRRWCDDLADRLLYGPRLRRPLIVVGAIATLIAAGSIAGARAWLTYYATPVRTVQKAGAFDPLREGFLLHNRVAGTVAANPERNGYDGWRVFGSGGGDYYYTPLRSAQKRLAIDRGWTLIATMRAETGLVYADVDFAGYGRRFSIVVHQDGDEDLVRLQTQLVPTFQGLDLRLPHVADAYRVYELRYDPGLQTADLWIDGQKRLEHYRGLSQYQDDMGLIFGANSYKRETGAGSFQLVRLEINP